MPIAFNIYDQLGRKVQVLYEGTQVAGKHKLSWDTKGTNGLALPSGLYIYELVTPKKTIRKKMIMK